MPPVVSRHIYRITLLAGIVIVSTGTIFYHFAEHWSWVNSYYFSIVTLSTVGYGDLVPTTDTAKIFTTFYILAGVGVLTTFITVNIRYRGAKIAERRENRKKKKLQKNAEQ